MNPSSPGIADVAYYVDILANRGPFTSDQTLLTDAETASQVKQNARDPYLWASQFADAMIKMGQISVITGNAGEIRTNCRAMLFGTINDFSTYGIMSGYNIKGKCACPLCEESTYWMQLEHCTKNVFQGHRTFIPLTHCYRLLSKAFNGNIEECRALMPLIRYNLLENIQNLSNNFGKSCK